MRRILSINDKMEFLGFSGLLDDLLQPRHSTFPICLPKKNSKLLSENSILSSFNLARPYSPDIIFSFIQRCIFIHFFIDEREIVIRISSLVSQE
jgi:hypothetical protein